MRSIIKPVRWAALALLPAVLLGAATIKGPDLYTATTFVTGQRLETRKPGIEEAMKTVLQKVTGAARILASRDLDAVLATSESAVVRYSYHDRMEGIPHHDEQGSRDRPYDLTVHFDPAKIDAIVATLGYRKWPLPRPTITPLVRVDFESNRFFVASDAEMGTGERDALLAEAAKRGLPLALPDRSMLQQANAASLDMDAPPPASLVAIAKRAHGAAVLVGILDWDADKLVWKSRWLMPSEGTMSRWQATSETFDGAFRAGLNGAAALLSKQP
ncbi:DUF2066 domain-containing protein [Jiella sp. MQZ9-1]|uniref:DUF2066 domain-containing protein n=1 Tax=Jiella flava TaxID=2816857 RepID=A0A939JXZ3_9HYPH|nr:DUF2066 domain-containing protein [Jiella flava]MBO0663876.1 DUF2066 domain-containing protein [Jiella flava]MCD2472448.1 DUF2066 domain-containing protein [Jiella flava]